MGLIGPNGAGQTTLFDLISGTVRPLVDRKRLELARAPATRPKLLLLDELLAGTQASRVPGDGCDGRRRADRAA